MRTFRLSSYWLGSKGLRAVFEVLDAEGEARVVGGAVRNSLLGRPLGDIDIATTLTPDRVASIAQRAGFAVHETGLAHGTLTLVAEGQPFEVTTLREDVSTDGRRATVRFTEDWSIDAGRRDFTMNALYVDAQGTLYDYVGGYRDCLDGLVRFIGDPEQRIVEDHLRILRFFRIQAAYGRTGMDDASLSAVLANKELVATLPAERVLNEMRRLVTAPRASEIVALMAEHDVLAPFIPGGISPAGFTAMLQAERAGGRVVKPALAFLALVGFDATAFEALADRLKFSRKMRRRGLAALAASEGQPPQSVPHLRVLLYEHGREAFVDGLMVARARGATVADLGVILAETRRWSRPRLPVGGHDLLRQGGQSGVVLGERLAHLESIWRESDFSLSRNALLEMDRERDVTKN
ncbi:MAG: CCA tRNA nucleotidyltransferase [Acuticoccus sp.]